MEATKHRPARGIREYGEDLPEVRDWVWLELMCVLDVGPLARRTEQRGATERGRQLI